MIAMVSGSLILNVKSPTYSKHADGDFIDMSPACIVAVSRAMSSFLVFGDMNCFSAAPRSGRADSSGPACWRGWRVLTFRQGHVAI